VIDNKQLTDIFKCSSQGGMRRSHQTNTLVIVSDHTKSIYEDRWFDDVLHYTGMGLSGHQRIDYAQNKTLSESKENNVEVFLFEVFEQGQYLYRGPIELAEEAYQEDQTDQEGHIRTVWVFPVRVIGESASFEVPVRTVLKKQEQREKIAQRLTDEELEKRAKLSRKKAATRKVSTKSYERNAYVSELAKRRARGICQLCNDWAPFKDRNGNSYLESHHIVWLSKGGEDIINNTVALCPNCHRKMHILNLKSDIRILEDKAGETLFI
jgi:5-methylcytosine-specific restriction enzyme A